MTPRPEHGLSDWLGKIDKGTMIGSRVFTDENGDRWFIGVGSIRPRAEERA